ncbi:MAG: type 4a pilus biogenesis protein PilO [Patescibacteria group bacterium]
MSNTTILFYVILTLSIGYAFIYPTAGDLSALMDERQKQENYLEMISKIEVKKNELLTEYNNISVDDKKYIGTILPDSFDFVRLISQIDAVGSKYGLSIDKTSFKEINASSGDSISEAGPPKTYQSATISFSFDASYSQFNSFMDDLGKSLRILDIKSMKLSAKETGVYSYDVEFEVYWLK